MPKVCQPKLLEAIKSRHRISSIAGSRTVNAGRCSGLHTMFAMYAMSSTNIPKIQVYQILVIDIIALWKTASSQS